MKLAKDRQKGAVNMPGKRLSVEDIEKRLGIDKAEPIHLTSSDEQDMKEKDEEMRDWYEDELREFYRQARREK